MSATLQPDKARCAPTLACGQQCHCARANAPDEGFENLTLIDGSIALRQPEEGCTLFIDQRGLALGSVSV